MGSNGAGKTTTLKTLTGQLKLQRGRITLDGTEINGEPPTRSCARAGAGTRGWGMLRDLSVAQNLELGAYIVNDRAKWPLLRAGLWAFPILHERASRRRDTVRRPATDAGDRTRADERPTGLLVDEASLGLSPVMTETAFD